MSKSASLTDKHQWKKHKKEPDFARIPDALAFICLLSLPLFPS
ncbi:hypothetical protein CSC05_5059 [Escherichia coli]|nr:hypothetical protein CSC05_5059 [Escherichia coli]